LPGANKIYFRYNADDQLVSRQIDYHFAGVNGAVTSSNSEYYVYNGSERVLAFDDSYGLKNRTTWGPGVDQLLVDEVFGANNQLDQTLWAAGDQLGSVNQLLDNSGAVVEHREYDSFGNIDQVFQVFNATGTEVGPSAMQSDTAFAGRTWDNDAELYYNRARWYEPESGRFIGEDPAEDGTNWYAYAGNDPVNFRDPTGFAAAGYPLDAFAGGRSGGTVAAAPTISSGATFDTGFSSPSFNEMIFGSPGSTSSLRDFNTNVNVFDSFDNFNRTLASDLRTYESQQSLAFYNQLVGADVNSIAQYQQSVQKTQAFDATVGGAGSGLLTGGKAIFNSVADTVTNLVTLGSYDSPIRFTPTPTDIANGFGAASISARIGGEIVSGLLTGGASKLGKLGNVVFALDMGGNILGAERGAVDIANNGASVQNIIQVAGGLAGLAGNLPELSNFRFDSATWSSDAVEKSST